MILKRYLKNRVENSHWKNDKCLSRLFNILYYCQAKWIVANTSRNDVCDSDSDSDSDMVVRVNSVKPLICEHLGTRAKVFTTGAVHILEVAFYSMY